MNSRETGGEKQNQIQSFENSEKTNEATTSKAPLRF